MLLLALLKKAEFHVCRYQAPTVKQAEGKENQREQQNKQYYIVSSTDAGKGNMFDW